MAPISKDIEVLTAPPTTSAAVSTPTQPRHDATATGSKPQPVALEVPVTVNGARTVEGSDKREPFSETTKTVLVFGNGAVIRLGSPVAAGQLLFLTNEKTKKEVVCQVVKSKNYKSVSGYVELEFTESVVGFWGMRFPSDRIGTQAPVPASTASVPPVLRPTPVAPAVNANKPLSPLVSTAPKIPEIKPAQTHAEVKPASQSRPADVIAVAPPLPKPPAPPVQAAVPPVAKKPEALVIPAPAASSSSLASSLASLLGAPEVPSAATTLKTSTSPLPTQNKQQPSTVAGDNSSEDLKQQAARLQEKLSSLLFSAAPTAKPAVPPAPVLDSKVVSGVAAQVLEIAKSESAPVKIAAPVKNPPPPMKSSLDTEEVKIPSWLEPLARNAAVAPANQESTDREKAKHSDEVPAFEEHPVEPLSLGAMDSAPEVELPGIGNLLPLEEGTATHDHPSGGSNKGILYGAIAAAVLLLAGGAWYFLHPTNAVQGTSAPITSAPSTQASTTLPAPAVTQPAAQPLVSQSSAVVPEPSSRSTAAAVSNTPSPSTPLTKPRETSQPAPVTRDNTRGAGTAIPAAATERIPRAAAEPEPKKPALGEVHLASPKMNRTATSQNDGVDAPTISAGNADANSGGLESGFSAGNGKEPVAPEAPLPIGGDVKPAELITRVSPTYPPLARNQHVAGDVRVDALIDANGRVTTMKVISGPTLLHQAAMDALRQWKYQPATLDGKQVPMHLTVTLQFRLQ
jgi:TonB family protein